MKPGQFITSDHARPIHAQHETACSDCPWRRDSLKGWLGPLSAKNWIGLAHGEGKADCHSLVDRHGNALQCAGLATYRANVCKSVRDHGALRLKQDKVKVFANPMDFINHHEG